MLPSALKRQWILAWLVMSLLGILASVVWILYRKPEPQAILEPRLVFRKVFAGGQKLLRESEPFVSPHNPRVGEVRETDPIAEVEEVQETDLIAEVEEVQETDPSADSWLELTAPQEFAIGVNSNQAEERLRGLEELLDLGFVAKQAGRFALAAQWFEEALKQNPEPNLTVSLLVDIYWLWEDVHGEELARVQLKVLWDKHQDRLGEIDEFLVWLNKVGLSRNYSKLGG